LGEQEEADRHRLLLRMSRECLAPVNRQATITLASTSTALLQTEPDQRDRHGN
jgi:hypothetical protein